MAKPRSPKKTTNANGTPQSNGVSPETNAAISAAPSRTPEPETTKAERKTTRKPEIVRTDGRATVVPINLDDEIRQLAYLFSERRGFIPGHETEDWLAAEHEVLQRYHQHSA